MDVSLRCLQEILDKSCEAIYVTDMDYNILYVNKGALAIAKNMDSADVLNKKCYSCFSSLDSPCSFCKMDRLLKDDFIIRTYYVEQTKRTYELRGGIIDWDGIPAHIEFVRDITSLAKAERKLDELAMQQKNLFEHIGVGMCMYRQQEGTIYPLVCNEAYRRLFQLPDDFGTGNAVELQLLCVHPDDRDTVCATIQEHIINKEPYNHIIRTVDKKKRTIRSILLNMDCVRQTEYNDIWYVSAYDVTEWTEAETRLGNVLENISGGIALYQIIGSQINTLMYTDGIPKMQGYTVQEYEELISRDALDAVYEEDRAGLLRIVGSAMNKKEAFTITYRVYHKYLDYIWVNLAATPAGIDSEGGMRYSAVFTNASRQFELYQKIFDTAISGYLVTDYDTKEIYYANRSGHEILSTVYRICSNSDGCMCVKNGRHVMICGDSVLTPSRDFKRRTAEIDGRKYQVDSHLVQWMGRAAVVQYFTDISEEIALQSKLQLNEDRFRLVVEKSGIGLLDYDVLTGESYTNMNFEEYAFVAKDDIPEFISSQGIRTIVHPEDSAELERYFADLQNNADSSSVKLRLRIKDGSYHWFEMNGLFIRNANHQTVRKIISLIDVDVATRQYEELKTQYDYEMARQQSFDNGIIERMTLDLTAGVVVNAANSERTSFKQLIGKSIEELQKMRVMNAETSRQRDMMQEFMSRENLLQAYYDGKKPSFEAVGRWGSDREQNYYRISASFAKEPNSGHVMAFINTRNVDAERTREVLMQRLLETNHERAVVVNAKTGRIKIGMNAGDTPVTQNYARTYEELAAENIAVNILPQERAQVTQSMSLEAIRKRLSVSGRFSDRCTVMEDGKLAYKIWTVTYFDESKEYILITVSDVTDVHQKDLKASQELREALEAARVASQAKSDFLARMSHEIRTPISTVSGILDLIRLKYKTGDIVRDDLFEQVKTAGTANKYLLSLINDILDITKIEKDELKLSERVTDIRQTVGALRSMIEPLAEKKNIQLVVERKTEISNWYKMDALHVQQILMNLLSNAIKFTPEGGTVTFTGEMLSEKNHIATIQFVVSDTGIGISEEFQKDLFKPFKQEYTGANGSYGGTGLGLSISRSLARMMNGDITCESRKGAGSTFTVTMQLEAAEPGREQMVEMRTDVLSLEGFHVLLCEDNEINRVVIQEILQAKGAVVTTANDGLQGTEIFKSSAPHTYDAVLMDIRMPYLNGLQTTKIIRSLDRPDAKTVPIIAMSANAFEEDIQASLDAGMNEHLSKPVDVEQLCSTLVKYCR